MALGIPENKQIGKFTERQRSALCAMLTLKYAASRTVQPVPAPVPVPAARGRAAELEPEPEFEAERSYELVGAAG